MPPIKLPTICNTRIPAVTLNANSISSLQFVIPNRPSCDFVNALTITRNPSIKNQIPKPPAVINFAAPYPY